MSSGEARNSSKKKQYIIKLSFSNIYRTHVARIAHITHLHDGLVWYELRVDGPRLGLALLGAPVRMPGAVLVHNLKTHELGICVSTC